MFSLSKLTPRHLPPSPVPWKQLFIDSNDYPNSCRQGTHKYRNMAVTIILHNHFQKDNVKQVISNTKMFFKRNMTKLLKRRGEKRPLCAWCSREKTQDRQPWGGTITYKTIKSARNNAWKQPRLFKTFASNTNKWMWPLSHTWPSANWAMEAFLSTQMYPLGGPFKETLPKRIHY